MSVPAGPVRQHAGHHKKRPPEAILGWPSAPLRYRNCSGAFYLNGLLMQAQGQLVLTASIVSRRIHFVNLFNGWMDCQYHADAGAARIGKKPNWRNSSITIRICSFGIFIVRTWKNVDICAERYPRLRIDQMHIVIMATEYSANFIPPLFGSIGFDICHFTSVSPLRSDFRPDHKNG